jgi:putative salt-induced outer membrane protein YdiY
MRFAPLIAAATWLLAAGALAQPAEVEQHTESVVAEVFQEDVTTLNASLGGQLNTGNTEAWQLNTGSAFVLIRDRHGLALNMDFSYGRANVADDMADELVDTIRNLRTKARYDFFITPMDALFLAGGYRWDTFSGLDARVQGQIGYMRNLFKQEKHRFWTELGYDLTYDNYDPDPLFSDPADMMSAVLPGDEVVHSARAFIGYDNQINATLTFLTGVEGLANVEETDDVRVNWDNALRSSISGSFQLEMKFSLQFDNVPVPDKKDLDTATTLTLIYTLL